MVEPDILDLLLHGNQLKRTLRSGWVQRGINQAENVAAHSYGTAFTALVISQVIARPLILDKVLIMALIHDLPEGQTTDIPKPAWRYLPEGVKSDVERKVMVQILGNLQFAPSIMAYWEELHASQTPESQLVHDADKFDMYLQAFVYERQTGNRELSEFWRNPYKFHFQEVQDLFGRLLKIRKQE